MADRETPLASARECVRECVETSVALSLTSKSNLSRVTAPPHPFTTYPALTSNDADADARASTMSRMARAPDSGGFHGSVTIHSPVDSALLTINGWDAFLSVLESTSATGARDLDESS